MQIGYLRVQHILDQDVDGIFGPRKDNLVKCFQSLARYYDWLYDCREKQFGYVNVASCCKIAINTM